MTPCRFFKIEDFTDEPNFDVAEFGYLISYFEKDYTVKCLVRGTDGKHYFTSPLLVKAEGKSYEELVDSFILGISNLMDEYVPKELQKQFINDIKKITK